LIKENLPEVRPINFAIVLDPDFVNSWKRLKAHKRTEVPFLSFLHGVGGLEGSSTIGIIALSTDDGLYANALLHHAFRQLIELFVRVDDIFGEAVRLEVFSTFLGLDVLVLPLSLEVFILAELSVALILVLRITVDCVTVS
jgi:hypothetical protein